MENKVLIKITTVLKERTRTPPDTLIDNLDDNL